MVQVYKGGLFKTATEHKEQIRYFSQQVYTWLGEYSKSFICYFSQQVYTWLGGYS